MAAGGVGVLIKGTHNALSGFRQAGSKVDLEVTAKRPAGAAGCMVALKEGAEAMCCGSRIREGDPTGWMRDGETLLRMTECG